MSSVAKHTEKRENWTLISSLDLGPVLDSVQVFAYFSSFECTSLVCPDETIHADMPLDLDPWSLYEIHINSIDVEKM